MAEICVTKGSTGNASEMLVVEPTVDEHPVAVDGRTIANDNVDDAVVEIDREPDPRAGGGVDLIGKLRINALIWVPYHTISYPGLSERAERKKNP